MLGFLSYSGKVIPQTGLVSLSLSFRFSTPHRGFSSSDAYDFDLISRISSDFNPAVPLYRKDTDLIDALEADAHEYIGTVQLVPGSNRSEAEPSLLRAAPYTMPHVTAMFEMLA